MSSKTFFLFGESITIDENIQKYVTVSHQFSRRRDMCIQRLVDLGNSEILPDSISEEMLSLIKSDVSEIIKALSVYGIYDKTVDDFMDKQVFSGNLSAYHTYVNTAKKNAEEMELSDLEFAHEYTDNMVTGLPFGIISNSVIGIGVYAAQDYSERKKQAAQASSTFRSMRTDAENRKNRTIRSEELKAHGDFIENCIHMINFTYNDMEIKYLKALESCKQYNSASINAISIKRSNSLLENIDIVDKPEIVILNAIKQCPYNPLIYSKAGLSNLLNQTMVDIIDYLGITDEVITLIENTNGMSLETILVPSVIYENHKFAFRALSILTGASESDIARKYYPSIKSGIIEKYKKLCEATDLAQISKSYYELENQYDKELQTYAQNKDITLFIKNCVHYSESEIEALSKHFGETKIVQEIASVVGYQNENTDLQYRDILEFLSAQISPVISDATYRLQEKQLKEIEQKRFFDELEANNIAKIKMQKEMRKKIWKWSFILSALISIPIIFISIATGTYLSETAAGVVVVLFLIFVSDIFILFLNQIFDWWD